MEKIYRFNEEHLGSNATRTDAINAIDYLNNHEYPSEYGNPKTGEEGLLNEIPEDVWEKAIEYALSRWTVEIAADGTPLADFDTEGEAIKEGFRQEREDKENGDYEAGFYSFRHNCECDRRW